MSMTTANKIASRTRRKARVRARISGIASRPRLAVFRSITSMYAQLIDDSAGRTLVSVKSQEVKTKGNKTDIAMATGKLLAQKALAQGIKAVVFDRAGYLYHGRVKALADGAREGGLEF